MPIHTYDFVRYIYIIQFEIKWNIKHLFTLDVHVCVCACACACVSKRFSFGLVLVFFGFFFAPGV